MPWSLGPLEEEWRVERVERNERERECVCESINIKGAIGACSGIAARLTFGGTRL